MSSLGAEAIIASILRLKVGTGFALRLGVSPTTRILGWEAELHGARSYAIIRTEAVVTAILRLKAGARFALVTASRRVTLLPGACLAGTEPPYPVGSAFASITVLEFDLIWCARLCVGYYRFLVSIGASACICQHIRVISHFFRQTESPSAGGYPALAITSARIAIHLKNGIRLASLLGGCKCSSEEQHSN